MGQEQPDREPSRTARFVARENRFVIRARVDPDGDLGTGPGPREVRAYLPNTARLTDILVPDALLILVPNQDPSRRTRWTATRVWDGTWVALEANAASGLVADHLARGGRLPGWPEVIAFHREVTYGSHRFDLEVEFGDGQVGVVEVKSLSRARDGVAPLSSTPSTRGVAHLAALASRAEVGRSSAAVFVIQRGDAEVLDLDAAADPAWLAAVHRARDAGVHIVAFGCEVTEHTLRLDRRLTVSGSRTR